MGAGSRLRADVGSAPGPDGLALLDEHGDTQVPPGHLDLAVNVHPEPPPGLAQVLAEVDVRAYPDPARARAAVAQRHGVTPGHVLLTNGAAEAFWALAHAEVRARGHGALAACVHPSFTAPEAALRSAGVRVQRVLRRPEEDFRLDPEEVDPAAGLVVLGRPDNPTGRTEDVDVLQRLVAPDRLLVVDEAFAEHRGDGLGLDADRGDLPGLVQVRSLTKVWGAAGLRLGYVVADPAVVARLAQAVQPWPVNAVALAVLERLLGPGHRVEVEAERRRRAAAVDADREALVPRLRALGLRVWAGQAPYLLLRGPVADLRGRLLAHGVAARRCDTFPGLDDTFVRVAVPGAAGADVLVAALGAVLADVPADVPADGRAELTAGIGADVRAEGAAPVSRRRRIRPLAVAAVRRADGAVLVQRGFDPTREESFHRLIGGGIDVGESAEEAVVREFAEELGARLVEVRLLGWLESRFVFDGRPGHEIVAVHAASITEPRLLEPDDLGLVAGTASTAHWVPVDELLHGARPLVPEEVVPLLRAWLAAADPGPGADADPGADPGAAPGADPGADLGADPGADPGADRS